MEDKNRNFDGSENNEDNPNWGSVGSHLLRYGRPSYYGGKSDLANDCRPNPRLVSNAVCKSDALVPNNKGLSDFVWAWGQFLDHEIDLTGPAEPKEEKNITTPVDDEFPNFTIPFERSVYDPATGGNVSNPRQQINQISAYIDATNVYGSNDTRAAALRLFDGSGKLKTSNNNLLPFNLAGLDNAQPPGDENFFLAGDVRVNEHAILISMHTLFMREHNRRCDLIVAGDPSLAGNDEAIYQQARRIVSALMQVITYEEFLPALLGDQGISPYKGYNPYVNPSISNLFSTACYRLGHSMLSPEVTPTGLNPIRLRDMFFTPQLIIDNGIDAFLSGLGKQVMQEIDTRIVEDVRSFLFAAPDTSNKTLLDLAALNIQRGRDHGLPGYNDCRVNLGLKAKNRFSEITSDKKLEKALSDVYKDIDYIDPWVGGLAEDFHAAANVGELIFTVLKDQFERLRDGDRFWYEHDSAFTPSEVSALKQTRLADVILANTNINEIQENVFYAETAPLAGKKKKAKSGQKAPA